MRQPFVPQTLPGDTMPEMGAVPDFTMEPIAYSTMLDSPPFLLPGVVLALPQLR